MIIFTSTKSSTLSGLILILCLIVSLGSAYAEDRLEVKKTTEPESLQNLIKPFPGNNGKVWLGGDSATSIKVSEDRYVWLFGDTILGKVNRGKRDYSVFIHNTVGIARKNETGQFGRIVKHHQNSESGIEPIFESSQDNVFYWPLVGKQLGSDLLIGASKVTTAKTSGFKILGTTLFLVSNPEARPERWQYSKEFLEKENDVVWGSAFVKHNGWLYVFGRRGSGLGAKSVLARISLKEARNENWGQRKVYSSGNWVKEGKASNLSGLSGTSETTIQYSDFFGWYCLQIPPLGYEAHLYTAKQLTGPWQDHGTVYEVPEPWSTETTEKGKHVFISYAAKSHPELSREPGEIVFTYNVNLSPYVKGLSGKLNKYIGQKKYEGLYVPRFVRLEFAPKKGSS